MPVPVDLFCTKCDALLPREDVNAPADLVLCRSCGQVSRYSETEQSVRDEEIMRIVPKSVQVRKTALGQEVTWLKSRTLAMAVLCTVLMGSIVQVVILRDWMLDWLVAGIIITDFIVFLIVAFVILRRVTLTLQPGRGELFCGVGFLGLRKQFDLHGAVEIFSSERSSSSAAGGVVHVIVVKQAQGRQIKFGRGMADDARQYMMAALRQMRR